LRGGECVRRYVGIQNLEFLDFYPDGLEVDRLILAGQFVGGDSGNFFGGEWRRHLLDDALKLGGERPDFSVIYLNVLQGCGGLAIGIVGIGGEAEANYALVGLLGVGVELREAGQVADDDGQDSGGRGVEGSEMTDGTLAENAAHAVDHVV